MTVTNSRESAYEAQLFVEHPASISYVGASKSGAVICNRFNSTTVACTLGNPLRRADAAILTLRFDPSGLEDSSAGLAFRLFANSTSREVAPQPPAQLAVRVVKKVELSVHGRARPEQSFYGGAVRGESAMRHLEDIGPAVRHTFQIYNDGPWRAPYLEVYIQWPHQVANDKAQGKWLLYLEAEPTVEGAGGGECEAMKPDAINPLKLGRRPVEVRSASAPASLRMAEAEADSDEGDAMLFGAMRRGFGRLGVGREAKVAEEEDEDAETVNRTTVQQTQGERTEQRRVLNSRVRRDRSMVIRPERLVDDEGKKADIVTMVSGCLGR